MLGLHFDQRFDIAHQGSNSSAGANGVIVLTNVGQHGIDVVAMERAGPWQTKVHLLEAQLLHVAEQFDLLLNGRVACTGALETVAQAFRRQTKHRGDGLQRFA